MDRKYLKNNVSKMLTVKIKIVIDRLHLSDADMRNDEKWQQSWYTALSFSGWILKTRQDENDGYLLKN